MRKISVFLVLLFTVSVNAYPEVKKVTVDGIVYNVDPDNMTASVGQNYKLDLSSGERNYIGSLYGDVVIAATVKYKGKFYPVTSIDPDAFYGCRNISSVLVPESVSSIDYHNFNFRLAYLKAINVEPGNRFFTSVEGVLFNKDMSKIIRFPCGRSDISYTIPSSVVSVESYAFSGCSSLKKIILPDNVKYIGDFAFESCTFNEILLPESVIEIGKGAFNSCFSLLTITIPEKVTVMGTNVFNYCFALESIICRNKDLIFTPDMIHSCEKLKGNIIYDLPADRISDLAVAGDPEYQYRLAVNYIEGKGVQKDFVQATEWLKKSAGAGYVKSQVALGDFYLSGQVGEKNPAEAVRWYAMAAKNGNVKAQVLSGNCYYDAIGVKQDLNIAAGYYRLAAEQGDSSAAKKMGYCYYNGKGVARDYTEAGKWYLKSALCGDAESAYYVARMLSEGRGMEKDVAEALKWTEKALAGGIEESRLLYPGLAFDNAVQNMDNGNYSSAITLFTSTLEYDVKNTDAYINRGYCYMKNKPADYNLAAADFKKALELDKVNTIAANNLMVVNDCLKRAEEAKKLFSEGDGYFLSKDYINAVTCYSKSIYLDDTNPYPYSAIGYCYFSCEQYADAIGFFDKALSVDPAYSMAIKGKEAAATIMLSNAISNALNSYSKSLNDAYNDNLKYNNSSYNNSLNNNANHEVERSQNYSDSKYQLYMNLYDQEQAEADSYFRKFESSGNPDDLKMARSCQSRANEYLEKAKIWK